MQWRTLSQCVLYFLSEVGKREIIFGIYLVPPNTYQSSVAREVASDPFPVVHSSKASLNLGDHKSTGGRGAGLCVTVLSVARGGTRPAGSTPSSRRYGPEQVSPRYSITDRDPSVHPVTLDW